MFKIHKGIEDTMKLFNKTEGTSEQRKIAVLLGEHKTGTYSENYNEINNVSDKMFTGIKKTYRAKTFLNYIIETNALKDFSHLTEDKEKPTLYLVRKIVKEVSMMRGRGRFATGFTDGNVREILSTVMIKKEIIENKFQYTVLAQICRASIDLIAYRIERNNVCETAKLSWKQKYNHAGIAQRMLTRFGTEYKNAINKPVCNKENSALDGSRLDHSVNARFANHNISKREGIPVWHWELILGFNGYDFNIMLPKNWRQTVVKENIAVVDSKIITSVIKVEKETLRNQPITIYEVRYSKREVHKGHDNEYRKNDKIFTHGHKGFVVKVGDANNPIALRLTDHYVQVRKIAQNSVTREFFKQLSANNGE